MTASGDMLLVGERALARQLAALAGEDRVAAYPDPFEALEAMAEHPWPRVLISAPRDDLGGLCRAARRLQPQAGVYALCAPSAEPEVRGLLGGVLDDYLISPPTGEDVRRVLAPRPAGEAKPPADAECIAGVTAVEMDRLIRCAVSVEALEESLADLVAARLSAPVRWADADRLSAEAEILLLAGDQPARALVVEDPLRAWSRRGGPFVSAVQALLPALWAAARRSESLYRLATTDHLTGAANRRYFYHQTDRILDRARRDGLRVSLLLYDLDNFKHYNDQYGHAAGDEILKEIVQLLRRTTRQQDLVARIGGDEFAVLFWDPGPPRSPGSSPPESARVLSERFCRAVREHHFSFLGPEARGCLTISGGLAGFPGDGGTCRELLRSADRALKQIKRGGKDGIRLIGANGGCEG